MSKKSRKGFTLLEIVVSLGLMAIILIPTGNMVMGSVKGNKAGENKQQASMLLQETVEYIKTLEDVDEGMILPNGIKLLSTTGADEDKAYYKVESTRENDYGFMIDGVIEVKQITRESIVPGTALLDPLGQADMDVIFKVSNNQISYTDENIDISEVISGNLTNNINSGFHYNQGNKEYSGDLGVTINGKGTIDINGKEFKTKQDYGKILFVVTKDQLDKIDIGLIGNGNHTIGIFLYVMDEDGNYETDYKFDDYLNINIIKGVGDFSKNLLNKDYNEQLQEIWRNVNSEVITIMNSYKVKLNAVKDNTSIDSLTVDLVK